MDLQSTEYEVLGRWSGPGIATVQVQGASHLLISIVPGALFETRIVLRHSSHIGVGSDIYMDGR